MLVSGTSSSLGRRPLLSLVVRRASHQIDSRPQLVFYVEAVAVPCPKEILMRSRIPVLLFGAFLLAIAGWAAANAGSGKARAAEEKPPKQPLSVSLLQLIATPDAFDGKYVRVHGFVRIEHEGTAIYLHREDAEHMLTKNGLWLAANDAAPEGSKEAKVKDRYALIEGRFTAKKKGHMGLWSGSIEDLTRMEPWEIRKAKK
jgi:hypothetical protein